MKVLAIVFATFCLLIPVIGRGQQQGQTRPAEAPPTDITANEILGVIKGGAKVQVVIASVPGHGTPGVAGQGTEGPIALPDGTMVFCETILGRVAKAWAPINSRASPLSGPMT